MKTRSFVLSTCFALASLLWITFPALAQVAPPLGTVQQFGALGGAGVTGQAGNGALINGDVGSSPTATITNFPPSSAVLPFVVHFANDAVVQQAQLDATTAYNALAVQGPGTVLADNLATVGPLTAGSYSFATGTPDLPAGATLVLNGPGIFVFNVGSTLTMNVLSNVTGTANPCNIYWRVGSSAILNGNTFLGTVIALVSVTVGDRVGPLLGQILTGRVVARTGAVTMAGDGGTTIGGCSAPAVVVPPPATLTCPPAGLTAGGVPGTATVTLTGPAPAGGTVVTLTSSAPGTASVPASVTVLAGATSATFTVTPGATPGPATISATTAGGGPVTCTLVVGAAPIPTLDSFGLAILIVLLSGVGVFVMNRFHS